jgi:hypothetical protein
MARKQWILAGVVFVLLLLLAAGLGVLWLVHNVPGAARLVYGDPPTATPLPTARATFTAVLVPATLTPSPTQPQATATPTSSPTLAPTHTPAEAATQEPPPQPTATTPPTATPTPEPPTATPKPPTATPRPQWIVFETERGSLGDYEIYVMSPDGSNLKNLSNSWADDVAPVFAPDGRHIAFSSLRDTVAGKWDLGPSSIYIMDFDPATGNGGGNVFRLTDVESDDGWATWSPDSKRVGSLPGLVARRQKDRLHLQSEWKLRSLGHERRRFQPG